MNLLAERIKGLREEHKLTQQQLAKKSGLSPRTIFGIEKGEPVSLNALQQLLSAYKLSEARELEYVIAWLYAQTGQFADKIFIRKTEGLTGNDRLLRLFNGLTKGEQDEIIKAMERRTLVMQGLKALNDTWERFEHEARKRK